MAKEEEQPNKLRWGDLSDDGGDAAADEYLKRLLPPTRVIGPDENGIKKVVEYKFREDGSTVKVTTTTRHRKLADTRRSKRVAERRSWAKFGAAAHDDVRGSLTTVSTEEIFFERPTAPGTDQDQTGDPLPRMGKGGATLMVCRTCGEKGDHWTAKCPYKDMSSFTNKPPSKTNVAAVVGVTKGAYVPPSKRGGASTSASEGSGADKKQRNDENSVRVGNLSEDTSGGDLFDLFQAFGSVSRVYVVLDRDTGASRGFGYVHFVNREDAQRAITKLDGYGYDNLILRVEWADRRLN